MSYQNYLIKVGNYTIPLKYINTNTYVANRTVQDLDSYRDANGVLHRTTLAHVPNKIEFETPPMLTNAEFSELMKSISENYVTNSERKVNVTAYIPETDSYETQQMYMPDIKPTIYMVLNNEIRYRSIRLAFIGY